MKFLKMGKGKKMNKENALFEVNKFFEEHFINYDSSEFGMLFSSGLLSPIYGEETLIRLLENDTDDLHDVITKKYKFEIDADLFKIVLALCFGFAERVLFARGERPYYGKTKKQIIEHNRLIHIVDQAPDYVLFDYPEHFNTDVLEIHFVCKKEKTIKITDKNDVLNLLANLKNRSIIYGNKVPSEWKYITLIRQEVAIMLHKFFEKNSTLYCDPSKKTSNEICRVIHEIFLYTKIINKDESKGSMPEDYIRTLIIRSTFI
jgi:hypothetical protein